jgi:hypothetical protein
MTHQFYAIRRTVGEDGAVEYFNSLVINFQKTLEPGCLLPKWMVERYMDTGNFDGTNARVIPITITDGE